MNGWLAIAHDIAVEGITALRLVLLDDFLLMLLCSHESDGRCIAPQSVWLSNVKSEEEDHVVILLMYMVCMGSVNG